MISDIDMLCTEPVMAGVVGLGVHFYLCDGVAIRGGDTCGQTEVRREPTGEALEAPEIGACGCVPKILRENTSGSVDRPNPLSAV